MSYSLEILVVGQEQKVDLPFQSLIKYESEFEETNLRFVYDWKFMSFTKGIWYTLGTDDTDGFCWGFEMMDTNFNKKALLEEYHWLEDKEIFDNLTPLQIKNKYRNDFAKMIKHLINLSPIKTIMILPRYQGGDIEIIQGCISYNHYLKLLEEEKIYFNVCTIVQD